MYKKKRSCGTSVNGCLSIYIIPNLSQSKIVNGRQSAKKKAKRDYIASVLCESRLSDKKTRIDSIVSESESDEITESARQFSNKINRRNLLDVRFCMCEVHY